jgi:hypothetical protein
MEFAPQCKIPGGFCAESSDRMGDSDEEMGNELGLEPMLQAHIGRKLRELFDSAAQQPPPERFRILLDQLASGEPCPPPAYSPSQPCETASFGSPNDLVEFLCMTRPRQV